jgi:ankyrin repeat protein
VEQVMHRRVRRAKRRALRSRDARRRAALTKELANREKTNLHFACQHGKLDIVHQLCLHGAKVSAHDEEGHTPLMLASGGGHTRIVQRLLANAAYPHVTKLGFVSRRVGPAVNSVDDGGRTALHHAAEGGHHVIVKLLLEAGANAEVQDKKRTTALDVCTSPEAFHLLRSRAELYARRERLEGVALKRNVSYNLFVSFFRALSLPLSLSLSLSLAFVC